MSSCLWLMVSYGLMTSAAHELTSVVAVFAIFSNFQWIYHEQLRSCTFEIAKWERLREPNQTKNHKGIHGNFPGHSARCHWKHWNDFFTRLNNLGHMRRFTNEQCAIVLRLMRSADHGSHALALLVAVEDCWVVVLLQDICHSPLSGIASVFIGYSICFSLEDWQTYHNFKTIMRWQPLKSSRMRSRSDLSLVRRPSRWFKRSTKALSNMTSRVGCPNGWSPLIHSVFSDEMGETN